MSEFKVIDKPDYGLVSDIYRAEFNYMALDLEAYSSDPNDSQGALDCTLAVIRLISLMTDIWDCPVVLDVKVINDQEYVKELLSAIKQGHETKFILIAHFASYEYTLLFHNYGIRFDYIRDTATAFATLDVANGWKEGQKRGRKLHELSWHFLNIELDKTLQTSDWSGSLTYSQYKYSALDVGAPEGSINPDTYESIKSIVIELFKIAERVCDKELNMKDAFDLDQACVPILAGMEASGIPLNIELCSITSQTLNTIKENCLQKLCTGLGRRLQLDLTTGDLIVPEDLQKLLNNNAKLLRVINSKLSKQQVLSDVQMTSLEKLLKQMDKDVKDEEDDNDFLSEDLMSDIQDIWSTRELVKNLLEYKKYFKVCGEVGKYLVAVRPKTGCIHGHINPVGAGTSRTSSGGGTKSLNLQSIPNSYISLQTTQSELVGGPKTSQRYKFDISVRTLFGLPYNRGKVWGSYDYASQELRIAAAISKDSAMRNVFYLERDNPNLIHPETGKSYPNPMCDLHVVAATKMFGFLEDVPMWELGELSKKPLPDGKVPRKIGKIVNFCVGMDAEVLTKKGWRKYGEFSCSDEILTYDTKAGCYVWSRPTAINHFKDRPTLILDYKGDHNVATESAASRWQVVTTPDHRWWTFLGTGTSSESKAKNLNTYSFRTTKDIQEDNSIRIQVSSNLPDSGSDIIEHWDDLMVICSVMAHIDLTQPGSYIGKYIYKDVVNNLNTHLSKAWVRDYVRCGLGDGIKPMMESCRSRLGVKYKNYGSVLFDKEVVDSVFSKYGLNPYSVSTWYDLIHKVDRPTLNELYSIFQDMCGVSRTRTRMMSFNNHEVKDLVLVVALLLGYTITDLSTSDTPCFLHKSDRSINSFKCEGMYVFDGTPQDVWCPTTPTGTWVMRYNRFVGITGNSILYGKSNKGFSEDFGLPIEATNILINAYSSGFPELYKWIEEVGSRAKYEKTIKSAYGRTMFAFESNAKGEDSESAGIRKAVNAVIQGTAGDMIKLAMKYIADDKELSKLIIMCSVVHDRYCRG